MTEQEWLTCDEPSQMLEFLGRKTSNRKMRLYACACCRLAWHLFPHERHQRAIETAERYADGLATKQELSSSKTGIRYQSVEKEDSLTGALKAALLRTTVVRERHMVYYVSKSIGTALSFERNPSFARSELDPYFWTQRQGAGWSEALRQEMKALSQIFRDVFGNPFHRVSIETIWSTATVDSIAQAIYDEHAFDRLPILADALEDAGCDNADILNHCRQPGEHVRGCWVVDLLLDKQ